jgi:hypothetical protein
VARKILLGSEECDAEASGTKIELTPRNILPGSEFIEAFGVKFNGQDIEISKDVYVT